VVNFLLWIFYSQQVFWFWWNIIGAVVAFLVACLLTYVFGIRKEDPGVAAVTAPVRFFTWETAILLAFFILIFIFCLMLPKLL